MSTGPDLQIKITTQGDSAAIAAMARDLAAANDKAGEFGRTLTKLTNDQLLGLEEKLRGEISAAQALGKSTEQLKQQLAEVYTHRTGAQDMARSADATRAIGTAARTSADQLGELKRAGGDVAQVFGGLRSASEGGAQGLLSMLTAGRGLLGIFRSMGSVLAGPIGIGLGAAAAGVAYLGKIARQNQTAIEKIFAESAKQSEQLKETYAALEAAAAKSLDAQLARVNSLADAYGRLVGMMDQAVQRNDQLDDAATKLELATLDRDEQAALAAATTPEQREKVQRTFAGRREAVGQRKAANDALNQRVRSGLRKTSAEETARSAQYEIDDATLDAQRKRAAANDATALWRQAGSEYGHGSVRTRQLGAAAMAANREAELAEASRDKVVAAATGVQRTAREEIDRATHTEQLVGYEEKTRAAKQQAGDIARRSEAARLQAQVDDGRAAQGAAFAEQRKALQDELDRRPGMSTDPRNAALVEAIRKIDAQQAALAIGSIGQAVSTYSETIIGAVEGVTATVSAERARAQRLAEVQAMRAAQQQRQAVNARSYAL